MTDALTIENEVWLPVDGTPYSVSSLGRLRNKDRLVSQHMNDLGYMVARLSWPRRMVRVHRLVAVAFVKNPEGKPNVNHVDCDRANNVATNLEWCTQKENLRHSAKLGRMQRDYWTNKRSPRAALSDECATTVRTMYATGEYTWESISKMLGVSKRTVGRIIHGESYRNV